MYLVSSHTQVKQMLQIIIKMRKLPFLIPFLRPIVPSLSQIDSSLSSFLGKTGVRGDFGRGEDILLSSTMRKSIVSMNHAQIYFWLKVVLNFWENYLYVLCRIVYFRFKRTTINIRTFLIVIFASNPVTHVSQTKQCCHCQCLSVSLVTALARLATLSTVIDEILVTKSTDVCSLNERALCS